MHLIISKAIGHIEENNENKYLVFDSSDENKDVFKKYIELWDEIKNKIEIINDDEFKYGKDFMEIKFDSGDDLPLNKPLNLHLVTIIVRSVIIKETEM